jgi:16S rRNA C1402 (ribose-2'-O) methylase RsmI
MFEHIERGTISSLLAWIENQDKLRGEFIVVISGTDKHK